MVNKEQQDQNVRRQQQTYSEKNVQSNSLPLSFSTDLYLAFIQTGKAMLLVSPEKNQTLTLTWAVLFTVTYQLAVQKFYLMVWNIAFVLLWYHRLPTLSYYAFDLHRRSCNHHHAQPTKPMPSHEHDHYNHHHTTCKSIMHGEF